MRSVSCLMSLSFVLALSACVNRNYNPEPNAALRSVHLEQSEVKNQNLSALCATYTSVAFLESIYKQRTGKELNLSEAYVGYYVTAQRMLEKIAEIQALPGDQKNEAYEILVEDLTNPQNSTYFQGSRSLSAGAKNPADVFAVMQKYGVVPEKSYTRDFVDPTETKAAMLELHKKFLKEYNSPNAAVSEKDIIEDVLPGGTAYLNPPPRRVTLPGSTQTMTPVEYFQSLGINLGDFVTLPNTVDAYGNPVESAKDFDSLIQATKEALAMGYPVPITASVDFSRWGSRTQDGGWFAQFAAPFWTNLSRRYGHAMLVVDFVNRGGSQGAMSPEQLKIEVEKHPRLLDYLVVKNSWGTYDLPVSREDQPGYYRLSKDFLLANTYERTGYVSVVVPRSVAQKYFK